MNEESDWLIDWFWCGKGRMKQWHKVPLLENICVERGLWLMCVWCVRVRGVWADDTPDDDAKIEFRNQIAILTNHLFTHTPAHNLISLLYLLNRYVRVRKMPKRAVRLQAWWRGIRHRVKFKVYVTLIGCFILAWWRGIRHRVKFKVYVTLIGCFILAWWRGFDIEWSLRCTLR